MDATLAASTVIIALSDTLVASLFVWHNLLKDGDRSLTTKAAHDESDTNFYTLS